MKRFKRVLILLGVIVLVACVIFGFLSYIQWAMFGRVTWGV